MHACVDRVVRHNGARASRTDCTRKVKEAIDREDQRGRAQKPLGLGMDGKDLQWCVFGWCVNCDCLTGVSSCFDCCHVVYEMEGVGAAVRGCAGPLAFFSC